MEYLLKKDLITAEEDLTIRMWGLYLMSFLVFVSAHWTRLGSLMKSLVLRVVTGELWIDLLVLGEEFLGGLGFLGVVVGSSLIRSFVRSSS